MDQMADEVWRDRRDIRDLLSIFQISMVLHLLMDKHIAVVSTLTCPLNSQQ